MRWSCLLLVFLAFFATCNAAVPFVPQTNNTLKILCVFGHPGKSHFYVVKPILEELARRGHDLTVISYFPRTNGNKKEEPLPNYKDIDLANEKYDVFNEPIDMNLISHLPVLTLLKELSVLYEFGKNSCENAFTNEEVQKLLTSEEKYDLIFTENFNTDCFLAFVHKFEVPFVGISTCQIMTWTNERLGNPDDAANTPTVFVSRNRPMRFFDRLTNYLWIRLVNFVYDFYYDSGQRVAVEEFFGYDFPHLKDIARSQAALLVNTHPSLHGARPLLPNVVEIGGVHLPTTMKPLPHQIGKFLDEANEGVLYLSLGSMIKATSMPPAVLQAMLDALGSIPRKVLWKWEGDDLPGKPDNVFISRWLPQFDILHHPNVKAYFGHAGLLGLTEAIHASVPMVLMPMFGDQFANAAAAENRGVAVVLEYEKINVAKLRHALDEVFNDTRYRENMEKLSKAFRDRPLSPMETAVWWIEYVGRGNGLTYIRSDLADMPWYQRESVDVVLFLSLILVLVAYYVMKKLISKPLNHYGRRWSRSRRNFDNGRSKKRN